MPASRKKRPIEPDDLLRLRCLSDPHIAPDGGRILYTEKDVGEKNQYRTNLWLVAAQGGEPRQLTNGGKDSHGRWAPDGRAIAFLRATEPGRPQVYLLPADGGEATALSRFAEGTIASFRWAPDGQRLAVLFRTAHPDFTAAARKKRDEGGLSRPPLVVEDLWYRLDGDGYFNRQRFHLWLVDVPGGRARLLFDRNRGTTFAFDWHPDGRELAVVANLDEEALARPWLDRLYRVDARSGAVTEVPRQKDGIKSAVCWSPDGRRLAWVGRDDRAGLWGESNQGLFVTDAQSGKSRNLTGGDDYCLVAATLGDTREVAFEPRLAWHPGGERLYFSFGWHGATRLASIAAAGGPVALLSEPGREVDLGDLSADGSSLALVGGSAVAPSEVHLGEIGAADRVEIRQLTRRNQALLDEVELSVPEEHWVESAARVKVHTWVLRPPGLGPGRRVPAVLEIHGGPHAQYGFTFFHEMQLLAARGFAVFYSNPRGSKGYGERFATAIRGRWGGADWQDLQAVTRFMQRQPWVDGKRIAVMGGSYGGYMTNWAVAHSDVFAAAITDRSVSNLVSMAGNSDFPLVPGHYWRGAPWDRPDELWQQSPIRHFGRVKTPTLILHSEGDLRCNVEQAEQVFTILKLRGVPTRLVRYPPETSHGMSRGGPPDLRLHRLGQILDWLTAHLG